jgi:hypothetical protein
VLVLLTALAVPCHSAHGADRESPLIVQEVVCRGNATTSCGFIRGRLFLHAGQRVDEDEIKDAKLRLSWLTNFTSVDIHLEKGSARGRVLVVIEVVEANSVRAAMSVGVSSRFGSVSETFTGRIGDHNLFGAGKSLDLIVAGEIPTSGNLSREARARIEYVDPQLFGSNRYFLSGGFGGIDSNYRYSNGDRDSLQASGLDASVGVSFGRFSYLTIGYEYNLHSSFSNVTREGNGSLVSGTNSQRGAVLASYGFNSQDDPYFPTRGSLLSLNSFGDSLYSGLSFGAVFRHTWHPASESYISLLVLAQPTRVARASFEDNPELSVSYAHALAPSGFFAAIPRGRWYVQPGVTRAGFDSNGGRLWEAGVKVGVRLETRSFGIMEFHVFGSGLVHSSGGH